MSFYDLAIKTISNGELLFSSLKGKVVLIVNVASRCGYTHHYAGLEALYKKYGNEGLMVIGFPCNQFGKQEPGTEEEIQQFCSRTYDVTFPLSTKVEVNGDNASPVYKFLKGKSQVEKIGWNFEKFLISKDGETIQHFDPAVKPELLDDKIKAML
ncbi:hypothetical protein HDV05_003851 [Chytridiales sp. JEL 0842]|nr:hypothetical protein HDV05_003851 [Chytridiales sp. JEL 0842]